MFIERYRNYKLDLMDKTHIEATAQQVLKITENTIKNMENAVKNAFKEIAGCARGACVDFKTDIDHVDVADIVYPGYTFWYDEYGNLGAEMEKRLQERHSEGLAGIADELIHINTFMDIH